MTGIRLCFDLLDGRGRLRMVILALMVMVNTVFEVFSVALILPFIAFATDPDSVLADHRVQILSQWIGVADARRLLLLGGMVLLAVFCAKNAYAYVLSRWQWRFVYGQITRLTATLFERYLHSPYRLHLSRNSSAMISLLDGIVDVVFVKVLLGYLQVVTEALVIVGLVSLLLALEPAVVLPVGLGVGLLGALALYVVQRRMFHYGRREMTFRERRLRSLREGFDTIKEIKVLGREDHFAARFRRVRTDHAGQQAEVGVLSQVPRLVIETVVFGGMVVAVLLVLAQERPNADVMPVLGLIAVAALRMMPSVTRITMAMTGIRHGQAAVQAVHGDYQALALTKPTSPEPEPIAFTREIVLTDVRLRYESAGHHALDGVSLSILRGEMVGFVGPSGAGKTTLIDVLLGLLPPESGSLIVDGQPVAGAERAWQRRIGYVPQQIVLIEASVRENVALGVPPEGIDDARVWQALALASLDEVVRVLPGGLDAPLGERGGRLSGGQRQRIGIARALYHDPDVLVFDEATASLDKATEAEISLSIEGLRGKKTLMIIAHNLGTVSRCDRLFLMKAGRVADSGSFVDLLARNTDFQEMARLAQFHQDVSATP